MSTGTPVVVFDVNETLSDMTPVARRFADLGAPEHAEVEEFAAGHPTDPMAEAAARARARSAAA